MMLSSRKQVFQPGNQKYVDRIVAVLIEAGLPADRAAYIARCELYAGQCKVTCYRPVPGGGIEVDMKTNQPAVNEFFLKLI